MKLYKKDILTVAIAKTNLQEDNQVVEILKEAFDFVILNDFSKLIKLVALERGISGSSHLNPDGVNSTSLADSPNII